MNWRSSQSCEFPTLDSSCKDLGSSHLGICCKYNFSCCCWEDDDKGTKLQSELINGSRQWVGRFGGHRVLWLPFAGLLFLWNVLLADALRWDQL